MNRLTIGLLLGLIAGVPGGLAVHALYERLETPVSVLNKDSFNSDRPGSVEAAMRLADDYVTRSFVVVGSPTIWADTATLSILIAGQKCELTMQRAKLDENNRSGWRVINQFCM